MKSIKLIEALAHLLASLYQRTLCLRQRLIRAAIHSRKRQILALDVAREANERKQRQLALEISRLEALQRSNPVAKQGMM